MADIFSSFNLKAVKILNDGGVGVIPTDTIYGIVGLALNKKVVERIYRLRKRNLKKPMIILIGSIRDLNLFGIKIGTKTKNILSKIWPNKVSIILPCLAEASCEGGPCKNRKFLYLHRGTGSLAFRLPKNKKLVALLKITGPLVAPSANWEGCEPSETIEGAQRYFGDKIGFYIDVGTKKSKPSTLIKLDSGEIKIIREGAVHL